MKLKLLAVYDKKAAFFAPPMAMRSQGEAIRSFSQIVNDGQSPICKNPEDFALFQLGEYDDENGVIDAEPTPNLVISALELVSQD